MTPEQPERLTINGWDYEVDEGFPTAGENFTIFEPGDSIEYVGRFGGPWRVLANDEGVLTLEREARRV